MLFPFFEIPSLFSLNSLSSILPDSPSSLLPTATSSRHHQDTQFDTRHLTSIIPLAICASRLLERSLSCIRYYSYFTSPSHPDYVIAMADYAPAPVVNSGMRFFKLRSSSCLLRDTRLPVPSIAFHSVHFMRFCPFLALLSRGSARLENGPA